MKKKFSFLFLAFIALATASAQEQSEHLTFKGVPIGGTLNEYVLKMEQVGLTCVDTQDDTAILKGEFAGFKECTIDISTLKSIRKVNTIRVMFPMQSDWKSLENNYAYLKSMLTEKYGEPSDCMEIFQGNLSPKTNSEKLDRLKLNECTWYTTYSTPKGDIRLSITYERINYSYVLLQYFDKINTNAVRVQAMDDL